MSITYQPVPLPDHRESSIAIEMSVNGGGADDETETQSNDASPLILHTSSTSGAHTHTDDGRVGRTKVPGNAAVSGTRLTQRLSPTRHSGMRHRNLDEQRGFPAARSVASPINIQVAQIVIFLFLGALFAYVVWDSYNPTGNGRGREGGGPLTRNSGLPTPNPAMAATGTIDAKANEHKATGSKVEAHPLPKAPLPDAAVPTSRDAEWWRSRVLAIDSDIRATPDAEILFIGDSITQGWLSSGRDYWIGTWTSKKAVNLGIDGDMTSHVLFRLSKDGADHLSKLSENGKNVKQVVLMIGTNNSGHHTPAADTVIGIREIVSLLRERLGSHVTIILVKVIPRDDDVSSFQSNIRVNTKLTRMGLAPDGVSEDDYLIIVDMDQTFTWNHQSIGSNTLPKRGDRGNLVDPQLFDDDKLHLNAAGYSAWTVELLKLIDAGTAKSPPSPRNLTPIPLDLSTTTPISRHDIPRWIQTKAKIDEALSRPMADQATFAFVGDSLTELWLAEGLSTWQKEFASTSVNLGIAADRTEHVLWRIGDKDGEGKQLSRPLTALKTIILAIGTNNARLSVTPENIIFGIRAIVESMRRQKPTATIIVFAITPRGDVVDAFRINQRVNVQLKDAVEDIPRRIFVRDLNFVFMGDHKDLPYERTTFPEMDMSRVMPRDKLHFTSAGYEAWAKEIKATIEEVNTKLPST